MLPLAYGSPEVTRSLRGMLRSRDRGKEKDRSLAIDRVQRNPGDKMHPITRRIRVVSTTEAQVRDLLEQTQDPNTGKDYISSKEIKQVQVTGDDVAVDVVLGYPANSQLQTVREQIETAL